MTLEQPLSSNHIVVHGTHIPYPESIVVLEDSWKTHMGTRNAHPFVWSPYTKYYNKFPNVKWSTGYLFECSELNGQCTYCELAKLENVQCKEILQVVEDSNASVNADPHRYARDRLRELLTDKSSCDIKPAKSQK